jgi:hypothetical protein
MVLEKSFLRLSRRYNIAFSNIHLEVSMKKVLVFLTLALSVTFSEITHSTLIMPQGLEGMISHVGVIAVGAVRHREVVANHTRCRVSQSARDAHYTIDISQVLVGKLKTRFLAAKSLSTCGSPIYSAITPQSGIENGLEVGKNYIFLFDWDAEQKNPEEEELIFIRAEEEDRLEAVLKAWEARKK